MTVRVGTSGWSYPGWVGPFYPPGTPTSRLLPYYASQLQTVEAHSTYRRSPTPASLARWVAQVGPDFRFAPKAHAGITHRRDLDGLAERTAAFFAALRPLGAHLGPVLFVLPHRQPDLHRLDALATSLSAVPLAEPPAVVFELSPGWWVDEVVDRLAAASISLAVVDRDDAPVPAELPAGAEAGGVAYVRLRRAQYSEKDLARWSERLLSLAARGGRDVYAFFKHDDRGSAPRYARALVERLGQP